MGGRQWLQLTAPRQSEATDWGVGCGEVKEGRLVRRQDTCWDTVEHDPAWGRDWGKLVCGAYVVGRPKGQNGVGNSHGGGVWKGPAGEEEPKA